MQCSKCGNDSIIRQPYSGQYLCRDHFVESIEKRAKRVIRRNQWVRPGDHVAVAFSGDRCSSALLFFLKNLTRKRHNIRVSAIFLDTGSAIHPPASHAERVASDLETEFHYSLLEWELGGGPHDLPHGSGETKPCCLCRPLRHALFRKIAGRIGATTLATGYTLEDAAVAVLEAYILGLPGCCTAMATQGAAGEIPYISPFSAIPAGEVERYADLLGLGYADLRSPHPDTTLRAELRVMLDGYTDHHPAAGYAVANLGGALCDTDTQLSVSLPHCFRPGELWQESCPDCSILKGGGVL
jgi:tRNA(Ile)-lysidine synthase TilS/MesJ